MSVPVCLFFCSLFFSVFPARTPTNSCPCFLSLFSLSTLNRSIYRIPLCLLRCLNAALIVVFYSCNRSLLKGLPHPIGTSVSQTSWKSHSALHPNWNGAPLTMHRPHSPSSVSAMQLSVFSFCVLLSFLVVFHKTDKRIICLMWSPLHSELL